MLYITLAIIISLCCPRRSILAEVNTELFYRTLELCEDFDQCEQVNSVVNRGMDANL